MAQPIKIGELNRPLILQKLTKVTTTTGEKVTTVVDYMYPLWAALNDVAGSESEDGKIIYLSVRKYVIRYVEEILIDGEKMLIKDIDGTYNINSIEQSGNKQYLILKCSKRE